MNINLSSINELEKVEPNVALDAVYQAVKKLYENKAVTPNRENTFIRRKQRNEVINKFERGLGVSAKKHGLHRVALNVKRTTSHNPSTRLATAILAEIQTREGESIQTLSQFKRTIYTNELSNFAQRKMTRNVILDQNSVDETKRQLDKVKY